MQFFKFCIHSVLCFIKQEKNLAFWVFSGMAVASLMLLICSDYYFTRSMTAQMSQFLSNRCTFVLDAPEDAVRLLKKLESDERVNNIQVILSTNDDITVGSWYDPEEAYINDKLVSGHMPTDADKENWCIVSFAYQQKQEAAENKIPVINDAFILRDGVVCVTIGILRDNSYDVLISQELMTGLLGLYADSMDSLQIQITYLYMDHVSEPQLEELNGEIIDTYHPLHIFRAERQKRYSFSEFVQEMGSLIFLMFLAVINYAMIYYYWIKKRFYTYNIYRICGLSRCKMLAMILSEQTLLFILVHMVVSAGYALASLAWNVNEAMDISAIFTQCVFTGGLLLIINILIFAVSGIKIYRESLVQICPQ